MTPPLRLTLLLIATLAVLGLAMALGSGLSAAGAVNVLLGGGEAHERIILFELRLPRILAAAAAGGLLALAGCINQTLTRNPLADPYVLGVAGGAAVLVLAGLLAGLPAAWTPAIASLGGFIATSLVYGLSRLGVWHVGRLLLIGIMLASLWGALTAFMLALAPPGTLPGLVYWLMGDLAAAGSPLPAGIGLILLLVLVWPLAGAINVLGRGEINAAALGIPVRATQTVLFILSSVATGLAVATAGSIGFIGLAAPHLARRLVGNDARWLIPAACIIGALLLSLADLIARTLLSPTQLPTGAITALLGVPLFIYLLQRQR